MPSAEFIHCARQLKNWTITHALPFWAENTRDERGGFYEHLSLDGTPNIDAIRRVRVQARQVYVYANAARLGWYDGAAIADKAFDFMCDVGLSPDGAAGFVHLINPDGTVHDPRRDFYDHAFYVLACASLMGCKGSERHVAAQKLSDELLDFIDLEMGACTGWTEGVPATLPRRQNPHMHFLETSMALYDATGEQKYMERAARIINLFDAYFFDRQHHTIREFFDKDWAYADGALGENVEPGHAAEWVWLLGQYARRTDTPLHPAARNLYDHAFKTDAIFLNDEESVTGDVRRNSQRLWVQTEVIRAHITQIEWGDANAEAKAVTAMRAFMERYLREDGTWHDQFQDGKMIATTIPTSSFYHIFGMVSEAARIANA